MDPRPGYGIRLPSAERVLEEHTPVAVVDRDRPAGRVRLSAYIGATELPSEIQGRVRVLVMEVDEVLVTWDQAGTPDCFPGGGIEPGESVLAAARREVWEETGWHLDEASIAELGWIHVESLADPRSYLPYPHPDTFMTVLFARPSRRHRAPDSWIDTEGFIARSAFVSVRDLPTRIRRDPISSAFLGLVLRRE